MTDSLWRKRQVPERSMKVEGPLHVVCQCDQCKAQPEQEPVALKEKFSLLLWDYQELERAFEKITGGKWIRKSNTPQRTWVGLSLADKEEYLALDFGGNRLDAMDWAGKRLKEKNQ